MSLETFSAERTHLSESRSEPAERTSVSRLQTNESRETTGSTPAENGMHEAKETQSAQEIADRKHMETKEHVLEKYGYTMTEAQKQRLEDENVKSPVTVMDSDEYSRVYHLPESVKGHYDSEGNIIIRGENDTTTKHVAVHETMHFSSYNEDVTHDGVRENRCGLRESKLKDGRVIEDNNRAINEGVTEMYTGRELQQTGEKSGLNAYPESRLWARRMETLVGKEKLERAYFGGDMEPLKKEVNRLSKSEDGWERFSKNVNTLEYTRGNDTNSYVKRSIAARELNEQYAVMANSWSEMQEGME